MKTLSVRFVAGVALASLLLACSEPAPEEERRGTSSSVVRGSCTANPESRACQREDESNARRAEDHELWHPSEEPSEEPASEEYEEEDPGGGIELDEEWLDCESYDSCIG